MEAERSAAYLTTYSLKVSPDSADRQQAEQHAKLDKSHPTRMETISIKMKASTIFE